jgi:uncharacterized cupin superfamily protein
MEEARLLRAEHGHVPAGAGWFILNVRDAQWKGAEGHGAYCAFETLDAPFADLGINIHVLLPGEVSSKYHAESAQEDFLVLAGECLALVEGEERLLRQWDLLHCPGGTLHTFVGAGDGPCAVLMVGARHDDEQIVYPVSDLAARHRAGVDVETASADEAYADWPEPVEPRPAPWPPR